MRQMLQEAIPQDWMRPPTLTAPRWMGDLTQLKVPIAMRACSKDNSCLFFEVQVKGRLARVEAEADLVRECIF